MFAVFVFSFNFFNSQILDKNKDINLFLENVVSEDDLYESEIKIRIQYINDLNKKVLINYIQTPDGLMEKLNKTDLELLDRVYRLYISEVVKMESEFDHEQKFKYKSLTPKSRISKILLIDELKNFPDSYSVISTNELLQIENKNIKEDLNSILRIFQRNKDLLFQMVKDVDDYRKQFLNAPIYYPNWENVEKIDFYNKINVVLWSYSNSKFYFNKIKSS